MNWKSEYVHLITEIKAFQTKHLHESTKGDAWGDLLNEHLDRAQGLLFDQLMNSIDEERCKIQLIELKAIQ